MRYKADVVVASVEKNESRNLPPTNVLSVGATDVIIVPTITPTTPTKMTSRLPTASAVQRNKAPTIWPTFCTFVRIGVVAGVDRAPGCYEPRHLSINSPRGSRVKGTYEDSEYYPCPTVSLRGKVIVVCVVFKGIYRTHQASVIPLCSQQIGLEWQVPRRTFIVEQRKSNVQKAYSRRYPGPH